MNPVAHYEVILITNEEIDISYLSQKVDFFLCRENVFYNWARSKHTIEMIKIYSCKYTDFFAYVQKQSENNLQFKIPPILNQEKFLELKRKIGDV